MTSLRDIQSVCRVIWSFPQSLVSFFASPLYKDASITKPVPRLQCPQLKLMQAINDSVWEGNNETNADLWRSEPSVPGLKSRIQDGRVWQTAPAHGGGLFFDNCEGRAAPEELRLGITLGFDG